MLKTTTMMLLLSASNLYANAIGNDFYEHKRFIQGLGNQPLAAAKSLPPGELPGGGSTPNEVESLYNKAQNGQINLQALGVESATGKEVERKTYDNGDGSAYKAQKNDTINQSTSAINQSQQIEKNPSDYYDKGSVFCSNGACTEKDTSQNTEFEKIASEISAINGEAEGINQAGDVTGRTPIFSGYVYRCEVHAIGYLDCCSDKGWGKTLNLANCRPEDRELGVAKKEYKVHYIGTYCSKRKKFPGGSVCKKKSRTYCVFPTKLARIMREQAPYSQSVFYKSFGSAESPNCGGFLPTELEHIDVTKINFKDPIYPFNPGNPFGHSGSNEAGIANDIRKIEPNVDELKDKAEQRVENSGEGDLQ